MSSECLCYNKGCAKKFIEDDNVDGMLKINLKIIIIKLIFEPVPMS